MEFLYCGKEANNEVKSILASVDESATPADNLRKLQNAQNRCGNCRIVKCKIRNATYQFQPPAATELSTA